MIGHLPVAARLQALHDALMQQGSDLALHLVYERPAQVELRPALSQVFFAQRCVSDDQLARMIDAFRSIDAYVELFEGELPFLAALADGRLGQLDRELQVVYNGIGFGVTEGGFEPGRMALIPSVADAYGVLSTNSDAYTCAMALHRFHSFVLLRAFDVAAPPVWHYRLGRGWMGHRPANGTKVIVKSTYEAWSVGVKESSVFVVEPSCERRAAAIAEEIGQPVTLQQFVSGVEVCLPIMAFPDPVLTPPVEQILEGKPADPDAIMTIDDNLTHGSYHYVPFDGPSTTIDTMRRTALQVFDILQIRAFGRMDFRIDHDGQPWLTDAAVTPGLSLASSAFASLELLGFDHPSFLRTVVAASVAAHGRLRATL